MKTCGDFGGRKPNGDPCGAPAGRGTSRQTGRCRSHPEDPESKPLTPFEERFVEEYLVDLQGGPAYRRAGGTDNPASSRQLASRLLKRPEVQAAIRQRREELREEIGARQQRILEELAAIAFSDIRHIVKWGKRGGPKLAGSSDELDDAAAAAISSVRQTANGIDVRLHSKPDAIQKLMQHLGMLVDRSFNFDIDWHSLPEEALERIMAGENPLNVLVSILQQRHSAADGS